MHRPKFVRLEPARFGDYGDDIAYVQRVLGVIPANGYLTEATEARLRGLQYTHRIPVTGELDAHTYQLLTRDQ